MTKLPYPHHHEHLFRVIKSRFKIPQVLTHSLWFSSGPDHLAGDGKGIFPLNEINNLKSLLTSKVDSQISSQTKVLTGTGKNSESDLAESITTTSSQIAAHPWPEWVDLMQFLQKKGYFDRIGNPFADTELGPKSSKLIQTACLDFGRDQFDILKYLSRKDIQVAVGSGCPSIDRKPVNAGKRLRAYVGLAEGDACSSCSLRETCDRAYVEAKGNGDASSVDVMRILSTFGLDPSGESIENKSCQKQSVKDSVKKLLKEMVEFAEMEKGQTSSEQDCPTHSIKSPLKIADWTCPNPNCNYINFARNTRCRRCNSVSKERQKKVREDLPKKKGDWECEKCHFLNFAKNSKCLRCQEGPPMSRLSPGDWQCSSSNCNYLNFGRNMKCKKCGQSRPETSRPLDEAIQDYMGNLSVHPPSKTEIKRLQSGESIEEHI